MSSEDDERRLLTLLLKREREQQRQRAAVEGLLASRAAGLSFKQRLFYEDETPIVGTLATRQSGKTTTGIEKFAKKLFRTPDSIAYACMPTRDIVRDTLWDRWKTLGASFGLTDDDHNETRLETRLPNGSIARFIGIKDKKRADRVRGQTADLIWVEEAATWSEELLRYFVQEVADPALGVKRGQMLFTGTPGFDPVGLFYDIVTKPKPGVSRHFLELKDNPAWVDPDAYLRGVLEKYGLSIDDPQVQREWFGRWVSDLRSRVYRLEDRNLVDEAAPYDMTVMALDLGATDESAICVIGWKHGSRKLQVLHEEADSDLDLTSIAERVKELQAEYRPLVTMVDGAAKQSVLEIQNRHGIALEATPKAPNYKPKAIQQVNADLRRGLVEIPRHFELVGQMRALQWKEKAIGVRENPGQPNDRCFVAGTLITTHRGDIPIESVVVGDLALTRFGFLPVLATGETGDHEVVRVQTDCGDVVGTHDHPVLTPTGWMPLTRLTPDAILYSCQNHETAIFRDITAIGECGRGQTDQFRAGASFITETATHETTESGTLSASATRHTPSTTAKKATTSEWQTSTRHVFAPRHGTSQKLAESGTKSRQDNQQLMRDPSIAYARCVESCFARQSPLLPFVQTPATPRSGATKKRTTLSQRAPSVEMCSAETSTIHRRVVPARVVSVSASGKQRVYNLTVDRAHEYFANGLLVSNCDAFLYAWLRALHYVEHEPEAPIKVGSPEWWKQEQQRVRDEHVQAHQPRDDHDPFRAESDPFSAKIDPW